MKNICIFTNDDIIWNIPLWWNTIKKLRSKYYFHTIFVFEDTIDDDRSGFDFLFWYLKTFGLYNFFLISIFSLYRYFNILLKYKTFTFKDLAKIYKIKIKYIKNTDCFPLKEFLIKNKIQYVLNLSTHILKNRHLNNEKYTIINAHAGFLPLCRGVMPFIWSSLNNIPYGFSTHIIENSKINSGKILFRKKIKNKSLSMIGYYLKFFKYYPSIIKRSLHNLENNISIRNRSLKNTLFSYPDSKTIKKIEKNGVKIVTLKDIINGNDF